MSKNYLKDLNCLNNLKNIEYLNISNNYLKKIDPI